MFKCLWTQFRFCFLREVVTSSIQVYFSFPSLLSFFHSWFKCFLWISPNFHPQHVTKPPDIKASLLLYNNSLLFRFTVSCIQNYSCNCFLVSGGTFFGQAVFFLVSTFNAQIFYLYFRI